jgi:hypothetical protein
MKIIQSFWTKPVFSKTQHDNPRISGGWLNFKYFIMSNCFSALTAKRYYKQVELFTDKQGYELFIDLLKIPYTNANSSLSELENEDSRLYVLGKLKTIEQQNEPFIHMDSDVYLWGKLKRLKKKECLIAQNLVPLSYPYEASLKEIRENFNFIPNCLRTENIKGSTLANIGIIGGNSISFFKDYCNTATQLLKLNKESLHKINLGRFSIILDEYLFICMAREKKMLVTYQIANRFKSDPIQSVLRFNLVPFLDRYIHLIGIAKQNQVACEQMELRFKYEFPLFYNTIVEILKQKYPTLVNLDESDNLNQRRITQTFKVIYHKKFSDILNMPLRLNDNFKISNFKDNGVEKTTLEFIDSQGCTIYARDLNGTDEIIKYFKNPKSINNLLEELGDSPSRTELKYKLIDIVTENLVLDPILRFN